MMQRSVAATYGPVTAQSNNISRGHPGTLAQWQRSCAVVKSLYLDGSYATCIQKADELLNAGKVSDLDRVSAHSSLTGADGHGAQGLFILLLCPCARNDRRADAIQPARILPPLRRGGTASSRRPRSTTTATSPQSSRRSSCAQRDIRGLPTRHYQPAADKLRVVATEHHRASVSARKQIISHDCYQWCI